ncbi:response regulator transcription factor [Desulfitibacter alkalitolerans]|uniref:response regulator transcription factor n=1 Tax=Desulfitibacter alkalitolerans TaxID=264641 RepID=UPI0006851832|nr:response regulator transcription factor [Desulfitibacter alkalitolerans]
MKMKMKVKVMLVDDHSLFMEGLQYLLETHEINVVDTAKDGREAFTKAIALKPDIILMDIKMPECNGLDALKLIKAEMPDINIVMLTTSDEDEDLFEAIKFGASGYLLKNTNARELVAMLSNIEKGEVPLSPGLAMKIFKEFRHNNHCANFPHHAVKDSMGLPLTERQLEVLEMVARGNTYKETAATLGLTERTIKYHMGRIIELLHMENRAQLIAHAGRIGLVEGRESR